MPRLLSSSSIFLEVVVLPLPDGPEMRTTGLLALFSRIMAGFISGGGLGDIAIRYGVYKYKTTIMLRRTFL